MKIHVFSRLLRDGLDQYGDFIDLDPDLDPKPDPNSSNFVDPDPYTINADPHQRLKR